jgi:hypothetical protein
VLALELFVDEPGCDSEVVQRCFRATLRHVSRKFGRPDAVGTDSLIGGLIAASSEDDVRPFQGGQLFTNPFEYFRRNES